MAEWTSATVVQGVGVTGTGNYVKATGGVLSAPTGLVKGDVGLGNVDNTSDATKNSATATLTNHRLTSRICSPADASPVAVNSDNCDQVHVAELSQATTFSIPTGTPTNGQFLTHSIYTTTARALTFTTGTNGFSAENGLPIPTTSVAGSYVLYGFRWNSLSSKWAFVGTTLATGPLSIAGGGTGTVSTLTGLVRGSASAMTAAELSGAVATSGSNATTLATKYVTGIKSATIDAPTTGDTNKVQWSFGQAITITRVVCSVGAATSVTIQLDERAEATPNTAGTDVMSAALVCDVTSEATTSFANATIAARVPLNLQITAVSGTPGSVRIHVEYTID